MAELLLFINELSKKIRQKRNYIKPLIEKLQTLERQRERERERERQRERERDCHNCPVCITKHH